ncbi:hypothetical protein CDN88_01120 [Escherichia coli]|nr:hypothetical protein CDN88_01120 [Escherichia coli]
MSLWDALRMNMMISYQELVRTFLSFGFPVILVGGAILLTGIVCTVVLNEIDAQCHLSEKLKYAIRDGLKRQQELDKWKRENMTPFMYVLNTPPVI